MAFASGINDLDINRVNQASVAGGPPQQHSIINY